MNLFVFGVSLVHKKLYLWGNFQKFGFKSYPFLFCLGYHGLQTSNRRCTGRYQNWDHPTQSAIILKIGGLLVLYRLIYPMNLMCNNLMDMCMDFVVAWSGYIMDYTSCIALQSTGICL